MKRMRLAPIHRGGSGRPWAGALLAAVLILALAPNAPTRPLWRSEEPRSDPPSKIPDRIILTWAGDPCRSQAVTWRTDTTIQAAFALLAEEDSSPDFAENARRFVARTERLETDAGPAHYHSVTFTDLRPNTVYAYRVGSREGQSEWFHFRTAPAEPGPFSFLYFGDPQNALLSYWSRVIRAAFADAPGARFMIFAGDLVTDGFSDALWGEWFDAGGWILATVPSLPVVGNHEHLDADSDSLLTPDWRVQFTLPRNGIPGAPNQVYFIDYPGARVVCLDSNARLGEQAAWLEDVLAGNPNRWAIVTFHHPVFSGAKGRDEKTVRELWKPIFDRHHVDLVLQGHDHIYARGTGSPDEHRSRMRPVGPVYVTSVSGPKMYDLDRAAWMDRAGENIELYQVIRVTPDTLHYRSMTLTGDPYDAFDLVRRPDAPNLLIETLPAGIPERTRSGSTKSP